MCKSDVPLVVNAYGRTFDVALREGFYLAGNGVGVILARPYAALLDKGMYLAGKEPPFLIYIYSDDWRITRYACQTYAVGCAEVPEAVCDEFPLIDLHCPTHMGAVAKDDV